jgi:hypothetical protein
MPTFPSAEWAATARTRLNEDPQFERFAKHVDSTVRFDFGEAAYAFTVTDGRVALHEDPTYTTWDYALRGSDEVWEKLLSETPPPIYNDPIGAWLQGDLVIEGNLKRTVQDLRPLKRMVEVFREVSA